MYENLIANLTSKDDKYACAIADKIISESQDTDEWYGYFDTFASLLNHPKSLVRNRALHILAANAQWDDKNRFDAILPAFLCHVTDEKPISARQCIKHRWVWQNRSIFQGFCPVSRKRTYPNTKIVCVR